MITLKIDVTLLDKKRFFKGKKGIYADLILIETPNGEYGDYMVKQSISKEERAANVQMPILGNAKNWGKKETTKARPAPPPRRAAPANPNPEQEDDSQDVPF
jgi:hypothetical protein